VLVDDVGAGALVLVDVEVDDVAALAIAAPPPARAAVRARVVRMGLIRWRIWFTSFGWPADNDRRPRS